MGERLLRHSSSDRPYQADFAFGTIDRDLARTLSGQIAEQHRLAFAQSLTAAVLEACHQLISPACPFTGPAGVSLIPLSRDAEAAARRFATVLVRAEPREAAHLAGVLYTSALPEAYRTKYGIFYTPPRLVDRLMLMAEEGSVDWSTARVLDPSCGGGAFLLPVALRMVAAAGNADPAIKLQQLAARLRGYEIDSFGAWLAQSALELGLRDLAEAAGRPVPQMVEVRDSLALEKRDHARFDLVIGNPPYSRITLPPDRRVAFQRSVYGHANLYGLFTDAALHWTKQGGVVAYVTPTSMLSGLYYKALRSLLAKLAPPLAVNFVNERTGVFADVLQETVLATYRRGGTQKSGEVGFIEVSETNAIWRKSGMFSLPAQASAPWLLPRTADQVDLARSIQAMPHRLSDYGYGVSTGPLVWNRFKDQFRMERRPSFYPVIWAESVTSAGRFLWRSEKRNHAPWFEAKLPKDNWLIVTRPCVLLQRTTAKEQARRLIAAELSTAFIDRHKGVIIENHLNMVRAIAPEPAVSAAVIAVLLNSATVDAAFRCINGSVAVSAFELEELPLPPPDVMARLAKLVASGAPPRKIEALLAAAYVGRDAAAAA